MKPYFSCVYCVLLLLSDALGTYPPSGLDLHHITAQSYAQTRNIARPPHRTLNPSIHGSDYRYRGYHYHHQPPRIPPPVVYHPIPLSPPVTYHHRHSAPMPPSYHHFNGAVAPQWHNIHRAHSPPLVHHHRVHSPFPAPGYYRHHSVCPSPPPTVQPDPTVAAVTSSPTPVVYLATTTPLPMLSSTTVVSQATVPPTLPVTTFPPVTTTTPVLVIETTEAPVETTAPVMLPVSTQSGNITTVSPVETGVDPCAMGHHCDHICVNSNASYYCKCRKGYILNTDKKTCSMKQVKAVVVEDPCKCEARLAFQKQTQSAIQQLTAKLSDITGRVTQLESVLGRA